MGFDSPRRHHHGWLMCKSRVSTQITDDSYLVPKGAMVRIHRHPPFEKFEGYIQQIQNFYCQKAKTYPVLFYGALAERSMRDSHKVD